MSEETTLLQEKIKSRKCQYLALVCTSLINFKDAVELFLPSVITLPVSYEFRITKKQEQILALALYFTLTITSILITPFSNKFGRKPSLLVGMYLAIRKEALLVGGDVSSYSEGSPPCWWGCI